MDYPGRMIAGFVMLVLIIVFPLQYLAQSNSDTIVALVDEKTQAFSDSIREKGRLDISMYEEFMNYLDATGELYDVEIEDIHPVTGEEISHTDAEGSTFACTDINHDHSTNKPFYLSGRKAESPVAASMKYMEPVTLTYRGLVGNARTVGTRTCTLTVALLGNSPLSYISMEPAMQTIERYMQPSFIVTAFYEDGNSKIVDAYSVSGFDATVIGTQTVTISYSEGQITKTTDVIVEVTPLQRVCPKCGTVYTLDLNDTDRGCPICTQEMIGIVVDPDFIRADQGAPLNITVKAIYKDGHMGAVNGWTSNYKPDTLGMQRVTVEFGGYTAELMVWVEERSIICPICGTSYPVSDGRCPVCSENVVSIVVDPGAVTVNQNDEITLSVIAYYADGSCGSVTDWSIDRTSAETGTYLATVSYLSASTTITLIVIPLSAVQCPICELIYEPSEYAGGCPLCSETISGIEAYLSNGANLVQYGATPSITIVLVFRDEHRELATEEHAIENYNPYQLGAQTIIVHYNEFYVNLEINVIDTLSSVTCPKGHVYYLNEDEADPGCPYCNMAGNLEAVYYFNIVYINEIIDILYTEGIYVFERGNYITVSVSKKNASLFYNIQNTFLRTSLLGMKKKFIHGGEVY